MPKARGVCSTPGCPNLNPCATHARKPWESSTRRARLPGNWNTLRAAALRRDRHRCRTCGAPATEVDHIARGDDHRLTNLQSLCSPCHQAKTTAEATEARTTRGGG